MMLGASILGTSILGKPRGKREDVGVGVGVMAVLLVVEMEVMDGTYGVINRVLGGPGETEEATMAAVFVENTKMCARSLRNGEIRAFRAAELRYPGGRAAFPGLVYSLNPTTYALVAIDVVAG